MNKLEKESLLISTFMGGGHTEGVLEFYNKNWTKTLTGIEMLRDCKYYKSWDWLMPVVEKIEQLGFNFYIGKSNVGIDITNESVGFFETAYCFKLRNETKLIGVYNTIIKFINWYNKNK